MRTGRDASVEASRPGVPSRYETASGALCVVSEITP